MHSHLTNETLWMLKVKNAQIEKKWITSVIFFFQFLQHLSLLSSKCYKVFAVWLVSVCSEVFLTWWECSQFAIISCRAALPWLFLLAVWLAVWVWYFIRRVKSVFFFTCFHCSTYFLIWISDRREVLKNNNNNHFHLLKQKLVVAQRLIKLCFKICLYDYRCIAKGMSVFLVLIMASKHKNST